MKLTRIFLILFLLFTFSSYSQPDIKNKEAIKAVMKLQEKAWSQNDLEGFMQGYWKSDSLKFYGRNGLLKVGNKHSIIIKKVTPLKNILEAYLLE